ncbi:MAG: PrgI family protein [Candidatus Spechtbacterales bacterium]
MSQYPVPQFIDREKRLIGPLTVRQVITIGINAGVLFIFYFLLSFPIFIIVAVITTSASIVLAFIKINGRPLPNVIFSVLEYHLQPKTYIWGREVKKDKKDKKGGLFSGKKQAASGSATQTNQTQAGTEQETTEEKRPSEEEIKKLAEFLNK